MATIPASRTVARNCAAIHSDILFSFLAPSVQSSRTAPYVSISRFSTSPALLKRDNNRIRGVSAIRRTGPRRRQTLSVTKKQLPKPVLDPKKKSEIQGDSDHGLWDFFYKDKKLLATPVENFSHGRPWTPNELRAKSWDDLHALWWVCAKERNRLATEKLERKRQNATLGDEEARVRDDTVRKTMIAVRRTLTERWYAWEDARKAARDDQEVDLTGEGPAYTPSVFSEDEYPEGAGTEGKEGEGHIKLPEPSFFNTQENPPTFKERAKERAKRILWNR